MEKFDQFKKEWSEQVIKSLNPSSANGRKGIPQETFQEIIKSILQNLEINEVKDSIIDIGCGNGLVLSALSNYFNKVYGSDYCLEMVKIAKEMNPKAKIFHSEAEILPFRDKIATHILSYSIFHYFPSYQYAKNCIYEFIRVTKDKGKILIGDILDQRFKEQILLSDKKEISSKLPLIHRYSEWLFFDLDKLALFIEKHNRVKKVKIINQSNKLPFNSYRKDISIFL